MGRRTNATAGYGTDQARWQAVVRKDARADGRFVFGVRTTGVYCRPSCPSRTPHRRNVVFYGAAEQAEREGYRACKRCWPKGPTVAQVHAAAVRKACDLLETSEATPSLAALARAVGLSPFHFHRIFKSVAGLTPKAYAVAHRFRRLRAQLAGSGTVTQAIYRAGFNSTARFYSESRQRLGMTPTALRRGGAGETIRFAVGRCSLGSVLVGASEKGVCAIALGDDPTALVRELQDRFPRARLCGGDPRFERLVARVVGLVEAPQQGLDLPLDVRGTAFQHRVWRALRQIPAGTTISYADLAERIGVPHAARAVAGACACNAIAIAIPCHRVVRTDGSRSGYRWGVERKATLLQREATCVRAG